MKWDFTVRLQPAGDFSAHIAGRIMKTFFKFYKIPAFLLALFFLPTSAYAATQGTLGLTSSGGATISVTKSVQAQISDIQDMTLSNWSVGDPAVTLYSNVCVYSSTGGYKVTATGSGLAGIFTISSSPNVIIYSVAWNDGGAGGLSSTGTSLLPGIPSTTFSNASTASATCGGGGASNDTARVIVNIAQLAMDLAPSSATAYTGTLTMLITPF
jgi:hypothetical protein